MTHSLRRCAAACAILALVSLAAGHIRLIYSGNGNLLFWGNASGIGIVLHEDGSEDIADGTDVPALRAAIATWNRATGTGASLSENAAPAARARSDWEADDLHLIYFDEDGSSGWFPSGSGVVAVTPVEFFTSGQIIDADILFNGRDFAFTTSGQTGRFDIQDVAAHELGHFLGLDHSGVAGSTMYPYVDPSVILHRSLSPDDIHGLRHAYPAGTFASIIGVVRRASDDSPVAGAHVVARNADGRTVGATLTGDNGGYRIRGLDGGSYSLWVEPFDQPVGATNLTSGHAIQTDFEARSLGSITATAGSTSDLGTATVDADVTLSLGRVADDYPLRGVIGETVSLTVRGSGLQLGSTLLPSDSNLSLVPTSWGSSYVQFDLSVPAAVPGGLVDLVVTSPSGDVDYLPGAIELTPPDPQVVSNSPASGDVDGGFGMTITGSGFRSGARVIVGDRFYEDGMPNGCTVVDGSTITLNVKATVAGIHDVVVIDPSGVEGRRAGGFQAQGSPSIQAAFPAAGSAAGGTELLLTGTHFTPGMTATLDGVPQPDVQLLSPTEMIVTTAGGAPGGPYVLTIHGAGGEQASAAFSYVDQEDPRISFVSPDSGPASGGTFVTITGSGFTESTEVWFGADPDTGQGGTRVDGVTLAGSGTLTLSTPGAVSDFHTVLVRDAVTQQAQVREGVFSYDTPQATNYEPFSGCSTTVPAVPLERGEGARGLLALLLLALCIRGVTWRAAQRHCS